MIYNKLMWIQGTVVLEHIEKCFIALLCVPYHPSKSLPLLPYSGNTSISILETCILTRVSEEDSTSFFFASLSALCVTVRGLPRQEFGEMSNKNLGLLYL
jgi:hypothetical protein